MLVKIHSNGVALEACSLKKLLDSPSFFTIEDVISLALDMANGLAYINIMGIFHRDLNQGNVLLSLEGHAKIADFGEGRIFQKEIDKDVTADKGMSVYISFCFAPFF